MEKQKTMSALVMPFTLLEQEALDWALLFFDSLIFTHPFPLSLPDFYPPLTANQRVRIWTPERTPQEIQAKDRRVREYRRFIAQNPDTSFLAFLRQVKPDAPIETRDEILAYLKGQASPPREPRPQPTAFDGDVLLCLIHDHLREEGEIAQSLEAIERAEKDLFRGMDQELEDANVWGGMGVPYGGAQDPEIVCPPALAAWKRLQNPLAPEAAVWLTTQAWVWREYYGPAPEDSSLRSLPLPAWRLPAVPEFSSEMAEDLAEIFRASDYDLRAQKIKKLEQALTGPAFRPSGRYLLVFPPDRVTGTDAPSPPLILLSPGGII